MTVQIKKPHYTGIMLVLASDNNELYRFFKQVWEQYVYIEPSIKVYFVYGSDTTFIPKEYDLVFPTIKECYRPGMIEKTIAAMERIDHRYNYDYFIRTNLSTFWDLPAFAKRLPSLPKINCFTGTPRAVGDRKPGLSPHFIAGVDLVISPHMVKDTITYKEKVFNIDLSEDWALSQWFSYGLGIPRRPTEPRRMHIIEHLTKTDPATIKQEIDKAKQLGCDHYRIKNNSNRWDIDCLVAKELLNQYYGKSLP